MDPSSEWTRARSRLPSSRKTLTSLAAVEELLDHLEHAGFGERSLSVADDVFVVWWR